MLCSETVSGSAAKISDDDNDRKLLIQTWKFTQVLTLRIYMPYVYIYIFILVIKAFLDALRTHLHAYTCL